MTTKRLVIGLGRNVVALAICLWALAHNSTQPNLGNFALVIVALVISTVGGRR